MINRMPSYMSSANTNLEADVMADTKIGVQLVGLFYLYRQLCNNWYQCTLHRSGCHISHIIEGILPKGPYLPCVSMAGRSLLAGYPRYLPNIIKYYLVTLLLCAVRSRVQLKGSIKISKKTVRLRDLRRSAVAVPITGLFYFVISIISNLIDTYLRFMLSFNVSNCLLFSLNLSRGIIIALWRHGNDACYNALFLTTVSNFYGKLTSCH